MNIILESNQFNTENISFLEKKNNIIIHGTFTKIIYSNELFSLNGLFFYFPIEVDKIETIMNKTVVRYHPYMKSNLSNIQEIAKIEYDIIDFYKTMTNCHKKKSNILSRQMYSGSLKVYRDFNRPLEQEDVAAGMHTYVIKISGIWETEDDVGITYKVFHSSNQSIPFL
jgi:hypothetical protein